jgi:choline kinase
VHETVLVVGYRQAMIRAALGTSHRGMPLRYVVNRDFEKGPRLSLWAGRAEFERDDVVLVDGDVLFAPPLLERVVRAAEPNVFLGEPEFMDTGEEINLYQAGERVVAIRRGVSGPPAVPYDTRAEWVGFVKVSRLAGSALAAGLDAMVREGRVDGDYEVALDGLLAGHPFAMCPTAGLPWIEIDFPEDLHAAEVECCGSAKAMEETPRIRSGAARARSLASSSARPIRRGPRRSSTGSIRKPSAPRIAGQRRTAAATVPSPSSSRRPGATARWGREGREQVGVHTGLPSSPRVPPSRRRRPAWPATVPPAPAGWRRRLTRGGVEPEERGPPHPSSVRPRRGRPGPPRPRMVERRRAASPPSAHSTAMASISTSMSG